MTQRNNKPKYAVWLLAWMLVWMCIVASAYQTTPAAQAAQTTQTALTTQAARSLAQRLTDAARSAPAAAQPDGTLYGVSRWNTATKATYLGMKFPGLLSCAYTVSAIFKAAGHPIGTLAAVNQVDSALFKWTKITDSDALRPGDVVFWKPRRLPILGNACGTTHWHVGIAMGDGQTVDNDWWSGQPRSNTVSRVCSAFAYARRPPG